eukprot:scaffold12054_cov126-Isochrysis_galbana.AAC.3
MQIRNRKARGVRMRGAVSRGPPRRVERRGAAQRGSGPRLSRTGLFTPVAADIGQPNGSARWCAVPLRLPPGLPVLRRERPARRLRHGAAHRPRTRLRLDGGAAAAAASALMTGLATASAVAVGWRHQRRPGRFTVLGERLYRHEARALLTRAVARTTHARCSRRRSCPRPATEPVDGRRCRAGCPVLGPCRVSVRGPPGGWRPASPARTGRPHCAFRLP